MKAVLITGGAGYIGSHIAYLLAQQNYKIIILDTFVHNQFFDYPWAIIFKADFSDKKMLETIFNHYEIEAVVHCAACIEVGLSVKDPLCFYENNVAKTITLLQVMLQHTIKKIIFSSSCAVYGNPQFLPLTEDHPTNPLSPYGRTKLMIEWILEDFCYAYNLQYVALRYFNAAGALPELWLGEQHQPETHLIPLLLDAASDDKTFTVFGNDYPTKDGTAIRDYLHILDIAQAHSNALKYLFNNETSHCFNLGTGSGISIKEMIEMAEKICNKKVKINYAHRRTGDPAILIADASKAQKILQWQPQYSNLDFLLKTAYEFKMFNSLKIKNKTVDHYQRNGGML